MITLRTVSWAVSRSRDKEAEEEGEAEAIE